MENWKDIEGFERLFQVSNFGRVKRLLKNAHAKYMYANKYGDERIMNGYVEKAGYVTQCLSKNDKKKLVRVHRLVALAFIPNPENKRCVNHKDCDKTNNHVSNLEWCTHAENMEHMWKNKRLCLVY